MTKIDGSAMDAETVQMLSIIDEEKDSNIIINAEGIIQFANKGVTTVRPDLESCALCHLSAILTDAPQHVMQSRPALHLVSCNVQR